MTRIEWENLPRAKKSWSNWYKARKYFPICKLGKNVVLHHLFPCCDNYEEWNVDELVPMFRWCHCAMHHQGKSKSKEHIKKVSESQTGKLGHFLGHTHTEKSKHKMSENRKGKNLGCSPWNKGIKRTEEEKQKISEALIGKPTWNKGIPHTEETRKKMSEAAKRREREKKNKLKRAG